MFRSFDFVMKFGWLKVEYFTSKGQVLLIMSSMLVLLENFISIKLVAAFLDLYTASAPLVDPESGRSA